jgi:hypothetical protein
LRDCAAERGDIERRVEALRHVGFIVRVGQLLWSAVGRAAGARTGNASRHFPELLWRATFWKRGSRALGDRVWPSNASP